MKYYMSETGHDMHDSATAWKPCKATTLTEAKREATREIGRGYLHHAIWLGVDDQPIRAVAGRNLRAGRWFDVA